jgi:CHASE2 domain-containing sensor protein
MALGFTVAIFAGQLEIEYTPKIQDLVVGGCNLQVKIISSLLSLNLGSPLITRFSSLLVVFWFVPWLVLGMAFVLHKKGVVFAMGGFHGFRFCLAKI